MGEVLLRIGELAERAGVSTRTVDFYTGLALLVPVTRTGGNFRLYHPGDVDRIRLVRRLESLGIRLEDIVQALAETSTPAQGPEGQPAASDGPDDDAEFRARLAALEEHARGLREAADVADPRTRGLLVALTARAHALLATAAVLGAGLVEELEHLPPL